MTARERAQRLMRQDGITLNCSQSTLEREILAAEREAFEAGWCASTTAKVLNDHKTNALDALEAWLRSRGEG